ncbi:hypothetical protein KY290_037618 [Solanum tuberosum]|uniref:Uncharacterized protein n=1 Tax=Solanum tuberosum TaxID=4113 RepID=A0ABQ7TWN9_SOLTU|nr:hypothetical protein KY290_037618 [Solanum tuberosum]
MSSIGTSKGVLEIVKFAVYVSVPIGLMYIFANNNKNLQKIMGHLICRNGEIVGGELGGGVGEFEW